VPEPLLEALDVTVVMFRDRRKGIRRVFEIAELIPAIRLRILYRWNPTTDAMEKHEESYRLHEKLRLFSGLTDEDIEKDLKDKQAILTWMVKNQIKTVNGVGKLVADYYQDPARVVRAVRKGVSATQLIPKRYLKG
jgi:flagellar protein FlaI